MIYKLNYRELFKSRDHYITKAIFLVVLFEHLVVVSYAWIKRQMMLDLKSTYVSGLGIQVLNYSSLVEIKFMTFLHYAFWFTSVFLIHKLTHTLTNSDLV